MFTLLIELIFQFQYGAIERIFSSDIIFCFLYFNSSMVRLKVATLHTIELTDYEFQFQYGAIESIPNAVTQGRNSLISIPVWCD